MIVFASTGSPNTMSAEQLEAHGAELCKRPVMSLFDNNAAVKTALETGTEPQASCADWEMTGTWWREEGGWLGLCTSRRGEGHCCNQDCTEDWC